MEEVDTLVEAAAAEALAKSGATETAEIEAGLQHERWMSRSSRMS